VNTKKNALVWAKEVAKRGAGEILLTSMDTDGVKQGFDLGITKQISDELDIPIIASGGAGAMEHFKEIFEAGIDGGLAASIFHFKQIEIKALKKYLKEQNIAVRL
jgi:cyclase